MKEKNESPNTNLLYGVSWRLVTPYAAAAPAFSEGADGSLCLLTNGRRDCFGRLISDKVAIKAGTDYHVQVTAWPEDVRNRDVCLHVLINWYDEHWNEPGYYPQVTQRDYLRGHIPDCVRGSGDPALSSPAGRLHCGVTGESNALIFEGHFTAPSGLILENNPPVDAIYAELELVLKWSETGAVRWKNPCLSVRPLEKRNIRLAALFASPDGLPRGDIMKQLLARIDEAATQGPDILCLNETALSPGMDFIGSAVAIDGAEVTAICAAAKRHGIHIIAGLAIVQSGMPLGIPGAGSRSAKLTSSHPLPTYAKRRIASAGGSSQRDEDIIYNMALLIAPDGQLIGQYRKIHVPLCEAELGLTPGDEPGIFEIMINGRKIKIGIMICFDAEFPELPRIMHEHEVEIVFIPTNGPPELGGRAKDSGAYWVLAASGGPRVFAPSGDLLAMDKHLCLYEADLNEQHTQQWIGPGPAHSDVKTALRQERRRDVL